MAYKFQIGDARLSGSLVQEGGITAAGNLDDSATVSGSAFTVDLGGLSIDGTAVGCTAAELNFNDGATAGTVVASKTVVVDANKDADGFRNISGSGTINADVGTFSGAVTAGTSFIIGSADMNETDLEKLDGITNGTVAASKAVVVDANKDADGFRNISGSGTAEFDVGTFSGAVTAGTSFIIGSADMSETDLEKLDGITNGTVAASKAVVADSNKDAAGFRNISGSGTIQMNAGTFSGAVTAGTSIIIGSADINEAELETIDGITAGTAAASKAVILDANKDINGIRNLTIAGNLTVQGTTTTVDSTTINISSSFTFEGLADDFETTLGIVDPAADRTVLLPNSSGVLAIFDPGASDAELATALTVVPSELNLLDAITRGSIIHGNSSGATALLAKGAANTVLKSDGTDISYGLIGNANIDASAGIALTKLESLSSANIIVGNGSNVASAVAVTGDIAISNTGLTTIQADAVEGSMLNDNAISGQTAALTSGLADTDEFLISDDGTLKRMDASVLKTYVASLAVTSGSNSATLAAGFNFFNNHGGAISANIPQSTGLSNGDIVHVKAGPDCSATNSLTLNRVGSDTFDAELTSIVLESPNAQVSFVLVDKDNNDFRLM